MGLLAPLYALAALAIIAPIVLHLIRRTPRGQNVFSSLMFLKPSPPTLTRRSRIDNWLLLLLRALAIALIAFAFARPFFRTSSLLSGGLEGRQLVILIDRSASMKRSGVWEAVQNEFEERIAALGPNDHVALYAFDSNIEALIPLSESRKDPSSKTTAGAAFQEISTNFRPGNFPEAIKQTAELIAAAEVATDIASSGNHIIVITDFTESTQLSELKGYAWPEQIGLELIQVAPSVPGNARIDLIESEEQDGSSAETFIRLANNSDSRTDSFAISWAKQDVQLREGRTSVQVPPGQTRILSVGEQPPAADRLVFEGDAWNADNTLFLPVREPQQKQIVVVNSESTTSNVGSPSVSLSLFLSAAPLSTQGISRSVKPIAIGRLNSIDPAATEAVFIEFPLADVAANPEQLGKDIRSLAEAGCSVFLILSSELEQQTDGQVLDAILQTEDLAYAEVQADDFALITKMNLRDPLLRPFATSGFNDFSKVRFWNHRAVSGLPDGFNELLYLDDDSLLMGYQSIGKGQLLLSTAGWHSDSSNFALSSKFVPFIMNLLDEYVSQESTTLRTFVGPTLTFDAESSLTVTPFGSEPFKTAETSIEFDEPGIFQIDYVSNSGNEEVSTTLAVQLSAEESVTAPLDPSMLDTFGISPKPFEGNSDREQKDRQERIEELEDRQKLWKWLIAGAIVILFIETIVARRFSLQAA